jgi:hypothetical protein
MRKFLLMLMSVVFLFTASATVPIDSDVGTDLKTEQMIYSETQDVVVVNFCQRTDLQATSEVALMYAFTDELIYPIVTKNNIYNNSINTNNFHQCGAYSETAYFNITTQEIFT